MRFLEVPALSIEDIEDPNIVDITETETVTASISGTTLTIDGDSKVSGEVTITLTGDVTVSTVTTSNIRQPSIHKIIIKTNGAGNFTYDPNNTVTASSVSTTTKTGSDLDILLITTSGGDTYLDLDVADYVSPAANFSNVLTGFKVSELTSAYGATAKLYKPDGTLLTTVNSAATESGVNFGYTETEPGDVIYKLEVEDDLGRKSTYNLPRKWINYAMGTTSTPGFQKFRLEGIENDYTTTVTLPSLGSSSTAKVYRTSDHGYMGIKFKIQGRNAPSDDWVDIANADENDDVLAFGDYLYHRVWVKPTAKATTTVSSSNVVTLTLSNLTEENVTTSFTGADPFEIDETSNVFVFEETAKIGTVPFTVTLGTETYTNAVTVTTEGTAYDYVTLAFANPTLSLTTSNVTISSAKLYRDDVLFHTYGTESNVVLRSDQTGTYQAIVNDVYYSNRVTPDFTTTRSVSAPQLEFDGYNKLSLDFPSTITINLPTSITISNPINTDWGSVVRANTINSNNPTDTPTKVHFAAVGSSGLTDLFFELNNGIITVDVGSSPTGGTPEYVSTIGYSGTAINTTVTGGDTIYLFNASTNIGQFVFNSSWVTSSKPTVTQTRLGLPDGTTRDLTTQSSVYIYETGTYTANVQTSDTFAYLSNVVNNVYYSDIQSPYFTDASTIVTDSNWSSSTGFQITSSGNALGASSTSTEYMAFDNIYTAANSWESTWLSTSISMPAWIQIQYPQDVVIKSYTIVGRDATNRYYPTSWQLQGATAAEPSTYVNLETTSGNRTASSWAPLAEVSYDVNTPGTAYRYFRLYVNSSNENDQVSINELKLFTIPLSGQIGVISTPKLTFDGFNKLAIENITQTSSTLTDPNGSTFNTNTASNVYVTDTGEYILEAKDANTFVMSNVYVGAVDTIPEFTAAFHHGAFSASDYSSAYSTVAEAATAGFVYSDTPAGTYTWGTLAHVKERENPDFTANSTLHTDYSSTYGWGDDNEWEVSAKDEFSSTYAVWNAFNKGDGAANNNWLSGSAPSTSSPQWLKIKYPSQQVIKSYVIKARDNASPRFPTAWKLQGANTDIGDTDTGWTDIGTEQTVSLWSVASEKSFDVSSNTTAYQYYRLRITGSRESASLSNSDYVAIGQWFLNTVNGENTTNHDQYTRYTYTPASTITANVLRVSGGGGGGGVIAGGGGAGGLLYSENVSLTNSAKSIVVGNGGKGGKGYGAYPQFGTNGYDTSFTGLPISYGGGGGSGSGSSGGSDGGSGGGGNYNYAGGGSGTANQGNSGGNGSGSDGNHGGGGGGAGGAGGNGSGSTGGTGGLGLDYTSTFGTTYGDSGWFASGGGGGGRSGTGGTSSNGGGTNGTGTSTACDDAQNHTGGGGGGAGYNNSQTAYLGGDGGSGIVIIKKLGPTNPPALNFDGYNKLSIDNVDTIETATIKKDGAAFATTTSNTVYIRDEGTYTAEVKGSGAYVTEVSKEVTGPISILDEYISEYGTSNYSTYNGASNAGWTMDEWSLRPLKWNRGDRNNSLYVPVPASSSDPFAIDTMFHFYVQSLVANGFSSSSENFPFPTKNGVLWEVDMKNIELSCYNNNARVTGSSLESTYGIGGNTFFVLQCNKNSANEVTIYIYYNRTSSTGKIFDFWWSINNTNNSVNNNETICLIQNVDLSNDTVLKYGWYKFDKTEGKPTFYLSIGGQTVSETVSFSLNNAYKNFHDETYGGCEVADPVSPYNNNYGSHMGWPFRHFMASGTRSAVGDDNTHENRNALKRGLIFDMMYFKYNNVFEKGGNSPSLTYDNYNKITLNQLNYEDTATVSDPNGSTYNIGTAKTMYVKDIGDYVFKISGTDKYVESNVYVSSVDLAGAPTKPIDFDGYNKLTLIDAGSNVLANVTYFSNTYELGSANVFYINGAGTYDLEMSGSNVFALSSNVVSGTVNSQRNATYKDFTYTITRTTSTWDNFDRTHNPPLVMSLTTTMHSTLVSLGYTEGFYNAAWYIVESDTHDFAAYRHGSSVVHTNWGSNGTVTVVDGTDTAYFTRTIPSTVVDVSGTYKVNLGAQLTFDNYNKLTIENFTTTDTLWPPSDGTWSISTDTSTLSEWTISGASYGNGSYKAASSVATNGIFRAYQAFEGTEPGNTSSWQIMATAGILSIELPEPVLINKYALLNRNYNLSEDQDASPKDFTFEGSSDGSTWVTLDTVTGNGYYTAEGTASQQTFTTSNTTAYKHYRLNVTTINGGSAMVVGEFKLLVSNPRTGTLTDPNGDTYSLGQTQNDIYIKDQGDYILEVTNSDQSAVVTKSVTGTLSASPGTPSITSILVTRNNGSDYTEASPSTERNGAWESRFVDGNAGTVEMDGSGTNGIGFSMYLNFDQTFTVNTAVFKMISTYQTYKDISFRCGVSDSDYITVDPGGLNFASTQTITFTFSSPITVNKLYFAVNQDNGNDLYNIRMSSGDIIINDVAYALSDSDKVLPSPVLTFDNYNKLSIENITPTSTTLTDPNGSSFDIGTASNVYIEHEGTYKMATGDANTFALVSKEVGTQPLGTTYNLTSLTRVSNYSTANTSKAQVSGNGTWPVSSFMATHNVLNNGDKAYGKTDGGSSRDPAQLFDTISSAWGEASHGSNGTHSPMSWGYEFTNGAKMISKMILYQPPNTHPAGNVTIKYWDGTSMTTVSNQSPTGMTSEVALSSTEFTFDAVSSQYWQIDCYRHATQTTGYTGLSEWEIYGNLITTVTTPSLTYDTSNKLSIENFTPTSTTLTDPNGSSFDIGTATDVYIRDSGTYSIASNDANTFVLTSNTVTGTPTGTTYTHTILTGSHTRISDRDASNTNRTHNSGSSDWPDSNSGITHYQDLSNGDRSYQKTSGGDSRDAAQLFDGVDSGNWGNASHGNVGTHSPMTWGYKFSNGAKQCSQMILVQPPNTHHAGNVTIKYWDGTSMTAVSNQSPLSMDNQTTDNDPTTFTFDAVSSQFWQIDCYRGSDNSTGYTGLHAWEIYDDPYEYVTGTTPSQVYDNTKTITVTNVPSTLPNVVGKIYKGSTAYTIHATEPTSNVIIENTGSYVSVFTTATQAFLTNAIDATQPTTTSDDNTIEDAALDVTSTTSVSKTIAFHDGLFADSDDPHGDGSITAAAIAGHVYSDTAPGTYTWGTLTSCVRTAMANNLYSDENFGYNNGTPPTAGFTTYKWTPPGTITNGRTLVVAGGGGGGTDMGGGGGAGGLLASTTTNIAHAEQTIQVGGGGARGYDPHNTNRHAGGNGSDSSISGPGITAFGGGGGATEHSANNTNPAGSGGSGGGASGSRSNNNGSVHGTGTPGQGHDGGTSGSHWYMGGGGGAGAVGGSGNSSGHGGDGLEDDILGTNYWWAGGGGSNSHHSSYYNGNKIRGGKGGGGSGAPPHSGHGVVTTTIDTNGITDAGAATPQTNQWSYHSGGSGGKHTGGGGGGGDHVNSTNASTGPQGRGGRGGSGIVAIKFAVQVSTIVPGIAGSTAVPVETTTDAPSVTLDATDTTVTDPTLDLDFTTTLPRTLKRYNTITSSSIGARFNKYEVNKKRIEKRISIPTSFSAELTANNASSPTTLTVTVANSKFVINGDETPTLGFIRGETYTFDQSDASNSGHPLVLATSEDGATQYTTGWTTTPSSPDYVPGVSGAQGTFIVPYDVPDTIYYKCTNHNNMGGEINTTFGNVFSLGEFTVAANTHVSGEYTLATNYDGTTSNLYVNGDLITQTTPTISAGVKEFILGKEFDGYVKNFKFWNKPISYHGITVAFHYFSFASGGDPYSDGSITAAATAGHVYSDTEAATYTWGTLGSADTVSQQAVYTWTPISGSFGAKILMVAGGGGGAMADNGSGGGGGGGAGGLVYNASVSLSGEQTIKVGGPNSAITNNGTNTEFTGLTTAIGGGKGRGGGGGGASGGSGGGGFRAGTGYAGTAGQGYAGGDGNSSGGNDQGGSGGGGAGGGGAGANGANGANGGVGLDYSSIFGTAYGDSGWFASGGGGGFHSGSPGTASNGGGGNGGSSGGSAGGQGQKHTGGGGGGGSIAASSNNGSYGGSGIVLIKY